MELSEWIHADIASLRQRVERGFIDVVPHDRWRERVDGGGIAPLYVLWHTARHHDVAVNTVLRSVAPVLDGWSDRVGVVDETWRGLAEGQDHQLVDELDPLAVGQYFLAVLDRSLDWLDSRPELDPTSVPASADALTSLGTPADQFDWLYNMWSDKPAHFFLSWEAVGHGYNHLGELLSIRNRMGLSPF